MTKKRDLYRASDAADRAHIATRTPATRRARNTARKALLDHTWSAYVASLATHKADLKAGRDARAATRKAAKK